MGFRVRCCLSGQPCPLFSAQLEPQLRRHLASNLVLDGENVGEAHIERVGPQRSAVPNTQQVHTDPQALSVALHGAVQHGIDLQLLGGFQRVAFQAGVLANGGQGPDGETPDMADFGDQGVGNPKF